MTLAKQLRGGVLVSRRAGLDTAVFTSGSTGLLIGVVMLHAAICSSIRAHGRVMGFGTASRTLQFLMPMLDTSILEVLTMLVVGGYVRIPSDHNRLNNMVDLLTRLRANLASLTYMLVQTLGERGIAGPCLVGEPTDEMPVRLASPQLANWLRLP
jgi:non-ribosomal peptide synthetase component F